MTDSRPRASDHARRLGRLLDHLERGESDGIHLPFDPIESIEFDGERETRVRMDIVVTDIELEE